MDNHDTIPTGLVGKASKQKCYVDQRPTICLIDSGSQVTLLSHSVFKNLGREMYPLSDLVVRHGGGGTIPYLGWTEIDLSFPIEFCGADTSFRTLVLVVEDSMGEEHCPLIVGTNTAIFRHCHDICKNSGGERYLQEMNISTLCRAVYVSIDEVEKLGPSGKVGLARLKKAKPVTIPAHSTMMVTSMINHRCNVDREVLIDMPEKGLPKDVYITPHVRYLPGATFCRLQVDVRNDGDKAVVLKPGTVVADVIVPQWCRSALASEVQMKKEMNMTKLNQNNANNDEYDKFAISMGTNKP